MKNYFLFFSIFILALLLFNCEEESISSQDLTQFQSNNQAKINPEVTVTASLHRGKKWSIKHNVTPCTTAFGLCNISVSVSFEFDDAKLQEINSNTMRISFLKDVGANQGDIFISDEDDFFDLPNDVATALGYKTVTIIPKNYVTNISADHPHGYVDLIFTSTI